jgi:toxin YoeB
MPELPEQFRVEVTRRAQKDIATLDAKLRRKLRDILLNRIAVEPHSGKKLVGELAGYWSVRLSYKDRIVYRIDEDARVVYVLRARSHYGE